MSVSTNQDTWDRLNEILDDVDGTDEYLTIRNPQDRRTVHIIDQEKGTNSAHEDCFVSLCGVYKINPVCNRVTGNFSEVQDVMTEAEIRDDHSICGNCLRQV